MRKLIEIYKKHENSLLLLSSSLLLSELGESLWRTEGHYHARRFTYLLCTWLIFWALIFFKRKQTFNLDFLTKALSLVGIYWCYKLIRDPLVIYATNDTLTLFFKITFGTILTGIVFFKGKFNRSFFATTIALLFVLKILTLINSPAPHIDVFTSNTKAVQGFLNGLNPYQLSYDDIYNGQYDYSAGFAYWPGVLIAKTLGYLIYPDVRVVLIICDILSFFGILYLGGVNKKVGLVFALYWFLFPVQNFVLEQAWVDPILVALTVWTFALISKRKFILAGLSLGAVCATKQYGGIIAIILGLELLMSGSFKEFGRLTISSMLTFTAIMAPFLIWDTPSLVQMSITTPLTQGYRADSFSLVAILINYWKISPSSILFSLPGLAALATSPLFIRKFGAAIALFWVFSITFFFGKQAFCNYYYLLTIFLILFMIQETKSEELTSV